MIKIVTLPIDKGSKIEYWSQSSPVGQIVVARTKYGICYLGLGECFYNIENHFPHSVLVRIENSVDIDLIDTLHVNGTEFQIAVWSALLAIPRGQTTSYSRIAAAVGRPLAVRAVGSAVGSNPVSLIIPCHRVVRSDGSLGGYFWGLDLKRQILDKEGAQIKKGLTARV